MSSIIEIRCVKMLRLLADRTRWQIVSALIREPLTVTKIAKLVGVAQFNASKHLRILREGGLLVAERRGQEVIYSIEPGYRTTVDGLTMDLGFSTFRFDIPAKGNLAEAYDSRAPVPGL